MASIAVFLAKAMISVMRLCIQGPKRRKETKSVLFLRTQLGVYVVCLLLSNVLSGVAAMLGYVWVQGGGIRAGKFPYQLSAIIRKLIETKGSLCTVQG